MTLEFKMPKLGESVTEGTIGRWLKQPGDTLEQYEPMLEVTTDKVDTEVSAPINGILVEILVPEGETVGVGTIIARLAEAGAAATNGASDNNVGAEVVAAPVASAPAAPAKSAPISPVVARLAAEHAVDLKEITGSGGGGRVTKKDIEAYVAAQKAGGGVAQRATEPRAPSPQPERAPQQEAELQQAFEVGIDGQGEPELQETREQSTKSVQPSVPAPPRPGAPAPTLAPDDELVPLTGMRRAIADHMMRS